MADKVISIMAEYGKLISELNLSMDVSPRIILKDSDRIYMTAKDADLASLGADDIEDVTDHDSSQLLAATALKQSKDLTSMILCVPPYTGICIDSHHEIPAVLDDMAQIVGPCVRMVPADEDEITKALTKATSVMVENGCLIAGGRNLFEAFTAVQIIEKSAETVLKAQVIGGVKPLSTRIARYMHGKYLKKYSKEEVELQNEDAQKAGGSEPAGADVDEPILTAVESDMALSEAQNSEKPEFSAREMGLREKLAEYGRKLIETGLVQGTWGNISVMLDRETMLCTPSGLDYDRLTPYDMVRVNIRNLKADGIHKPTSEKGMHAGIYRKYPDANAVIHTHSKYCSIFAASEMPLQVESAEKISELGEIIGVTKYALAGTFMITRNAIRAMKNAPGCILSHHGMIAKGASLEEAFENVRLIEEAAEEYINRRWEK